MACSGEGKGQLLPSISDLVFGENVGCFESREEGDGLFMGGD